MSLTIIAFWAAASSPSGINGGGSFTRTFGPTTSPGSRSALYNELSASWLAGWATARASVSANISLSSLRLRHLLLVGDQFSQLDIERVGFVDGKARLGGEFPEIGWKGHGAAHGHLVHCEGIVARDAEAVYLLPIDDQLRRVDGVRL